MASPRSTFVSAQDELASENQLTSTSILFHQLLVLWKISYYLDVGRFQVDYCIRLLDTPIEGFQSCLFHYNPRLPFEKQSLQIGQFKHGVLNENLGPQGCG